MVTLATSGRSSRTRSSRRATFAVTPSTSSKIFFMSLPRIRRKQPLRQSPSVPAVRRRTCESLSGLGVGIALHPDLALFGRHERTEPPPREGEPRRQRQLPLARDLGGARAEEAERGQRAEIHRALAVAANIAIE